MMIRSVCLITLVLAVALLPAACSGGGQPAATPTSPGSGAGIPTLAATEVPTAAIAHPAFEGPPVTVAATEAQAASTPIPSPTTGIPAAPGVSVQPGAAALPDPGAYQWQPVADGFDQPLAAVFPPDGSGRMFVVEQGGRIRIAQGGQVEPQPFLDISDRITAGGERGLLGLAFHPRYPENGYFYVNYTDQNGNTVIARFQATADDPNRADPGSEKVLLQVDQPYPNHNGGSTVFGPDGYLYLGLGDGGSGGDPRNNAQSLDTVLGKILRIDVDGGDPYAIPADNPFAQGGGKAEIWAYGLRNPWRFSFDMRTGDMYIADVGQNQWEEVDFIPAGTPGGVNFGWNYFEGNHPYRDQAAPAGLNAVPPVAEYDHSGNCSISGGYVYRGAMPAWDGVYLYGDYCSGKVWGLLRQPGGSWSNKLLFENAGQVTSFGQDPAGEIYLVDQGGTIYQLAEK